jgi:hypothetical protein
MGEFGDVSKGGTSKKGRWAALLLWADSTTVSDMRGRLLGDWAEIRGISRPDCGRNATELPGKVASNLRLASFSEGFPQHFFGACIWLI